MTYSSPDGPSDAALDRLAAPEAPIIVEHRQQLIHLLREASELEHTIMCSYLFAAFTLKQSVQEGITPEQLQAVDRWRRVLIEVARQEMLHLALVQNLLMAIGSAPHLARPNIPCPALYFPPGVQIPLIPFGEQALRHFMFLERPEGMQLDNPGGGELTERARGVLEDEDIVPRSQDYSTVGHLYRAIDIGFGWLTAKLGQQALFIGPPSAQATPDTFDWPELIPVVDLKSAHRAIDTIVEQGEGVQAEWQKAHFGSFLRVFEEFMALRQADPTFEPARRVQPGTAAPQDGPHQLPAISDRTTAHVADLFNVSNEILLLALARFLAHTDETPQQLRTLSDLTVGLMFTAVKPLGQLLTTLPFGPTHPGLSAGPTFEVFSQAGYLMPHREAAWILMSERLSQAAEFGHFIEIESGLPIGPVTAAFERYAAQLSAGARHT